MNAPATINPNWLAEYTALVDGAGLVELGHRTQIELSGPDRAAFLHNLSTNEIRKLSPGAGCEAFLTTVQGRTLAHVFVFATAETLILDTVPDQAETILNHLDHYLVCEQVVLTDRSSEWSELLLAGPKSEELLATATGRQPPAARLAHASATLDGRSVWLRRADLAWPTGFFIVGRKDDVAAAGSALCEAGATRAGAEAFEAARIERGFPLFGPDISVKNLPQEIARDPLAISFVKGCYLGQETVARIDALGHVNKTLVGVRFAGPEIPAPGLELLANADVAGHVTSATYSPRWHAPLALAYLRRGSNTPGTRLTSAVGEAEVVTLANA